MTVAAELALGAQDMEYIICIEGVGWPVDESDISSGLEGTVFTTGTHNSSSGITGGATFNGSIMSIGNITDELDPIKGAYSVGGMRVTLNDAGDYWLSNFVPRKTPSTDTIKTALTYGATTVNLSGTSFNEGDVVWVANREAIKLGTEASDGGGGSNYTSSTRGYLGTKRGSSSRTVSDSGAFTFNVNTFVYDRNGYWHNRRIRLYMHVPGEAASNLVLVWSGRMSALTRSASGTLVNITASGMKVDSDTMIYHAKDTYGFNVQLVYERTSVSDYVPATDYVRLIEGTIKVMVRFKPNSTVGLLSSEDVSRYALASAYRYRTEPGGTKGMKTSWDSSDVTSVQALNSSNGVDDDLVGCYMMVGSSMLYARKRAKIYGETQDKYSIEFDAMPYDSEFDSAEEAFDTLRSSIESEQIVKTRILLDCVSDNAELNRFVVNGRVTRNPIDVALCILTTRDDEYFIADATTGGTTTQVEFASAVSSEELYTGAALFCVEGTNKGESRVITGRSASTDLQVEDAFSNTPVSGTEYQVRNSIYDVLPLGWGMGIRFSDIDVAQFETIRDTYLPDAQLGPFIIGAEDKFNLLNFVTESILKPHGLQMYVSRQTGKLSLRYLGDAYGDGLIESYVAVTESQVHDSESIEIDDSVAMPIGKCEITLAKSEQRVTASAISAYEQTTGNHDPTAIAFLDAHNIQLIMASSTEKVYESLSELDTEFPDVGVSTISIEALLNTIQTAEHILNRCRYLLFQYFAPPPRCTIQIAPTHIPNVQAGTILSLTHTNLVNPYTGTRGWTNLLARCISTEIRITDGPLLTCQVELLGTNSYGLVAPACKLESLFRGSDGTSHYLIVEANAYSNDSANTKDFYRFAVGDKLEVRDADGSVVEGPMTIQGFGDNNTSDPTAATLKSSQEIIRVDETLTGTYNAGDYVTFASWSASNTSNMENYSAYGDSSGALTGGDTSDLYG
jgi:hypothetical protein